MCAAVDAALGFRQKHYSMHSPESKKESAAELFTTTLGGKQYWPHLLLLLMPVLLAEVSVDDESFQKCEALLERLLELDDVDNVYTNCEGLV